tara:strand:+ start:221 stop:391 length:171 start_codon:yes stop_codon:yes gene_type:complete
MKEYKVNKDHLSTIKHIFQGYIFRREEGGQGYVKCTDKEAQIIKSVGIHLDLVVKE